MSREGESRASHDSPAEDDWYFKVIGEELGPFTFDELVSFAEQGYLSATAEVKIGHSGPWTHVESVARLVKVLPSQDPQVASPQPADPAPSVVQESPSAPPAASEPVAVVKKITAEQTAELDLIKAQTAHSAIELATKQLIASAFSMHCEQTWWGWIGGVEYGPVEFVQLVGWVTGGRLHPNDFVRCGNQGQYIPVGNIPGLLHAANIINVATEVMQLAVSRVLAAKSGVAVIQPIPMVQPSFPMGSFPPSPKGPTSPKESVAPPSVPAVSSAAVVSSPPAANEPQIAKPAVPEVILPQPAKVVAPVTPVVAPYVAPSVLASSVGSAPVSRPLAAVSRTPVKHHHSSAESPLSMVMEKLKEPRIAGGIAAVLAVVLLLMGWFLSPAAADPADVARYKELKKLLDDLKAKRAAKDKDYTEIKSRAEKLKKEYVAALQKNADNKHPDKQALLWAVQDELPRVMKQKLSVESKAEKDFAQRLDEAAKLMRIRP